jgi:predicted amidohydrolase
VHLDRIREAREAGADLIVFPELSLTGYYLRDMVPEVALSRDASEISQLLAAAGTSDLVFGFVEQSARARYYNSGLYASSGRIAHVHRKVYLPTYGLFDEQRYFAAGHRIQAFTTERFGRVGLLVCEDFWHLSAVAIMQAEEVDLLICISNSPGRGVHDAEFETAGVYDHLCRTYAVLLGAAVVLVNRVGFEDGLCLVCASGEGVVWWGRAEKRWPALLPWTSRWRWPNWIGPNCGASGR